MMAATLFLTGWILWQHAGLFTLHGTVGTTEFPLPPYWTLVESFPTQDDCEEARTQRHTQQGADFDAIMQRLFQHDRLAEAVDKFVVYTWYCVHETPLPRK